MTVKFAKQREKCLCVSSPFNCRLQSTLFVFFQFENNSELQIIFESNAYLPPNFLLNADFQNVKLYFHPLYFFAMRKKEVLLFSMF